MWKNTRITDLFGIKYPILQGPFGGGLSSSDLVAAVSNRGGMGGYGVHYRSADGILAMNKEISSKTSNPYALNLWIDNKDAKADNYSDGEYEKLAKLFEPYFKELSLAVPERPTKLFPPFDEQIGGLLEARPPAFSFVFGIPSKQILNECRVRNIKTIGTATTVDEAIALDQAGVDAIVATGFEAGGHRVSFIRSAEASLTGTFALVPQVADKVKAPVIAAGGIADGRGVAAALTLGADAVQIGTAFLACEESNATPAHKARLFSEDAKYTVLTRLFTGRLARGIHSKLTDDLQGYDANLAPYPLQSMFLGSLRTAAIAQGKSDFITFWAGQSTPLLKHKKVNDLMQALITETDGLLQR